MAREQRSGSHKHREPSEQESPAFSGGKRAAQQAQRLASWARSLRLVALLLLLLGAGALPSQAQYSFTTSTGAAIDPGTMDIGLTGDDRTQLITLPFAYQLYGQSYTTARVSTNGNLQFNSSSTAFTNSALPAVGFGPTIFAYWDDLSIEPQVSGEGIFTSTTGTLPNRIFNIEWRTQLLGDSGNTAPTINFEIRLFEGQQRFDIIYGFSSTSFGANGASATSGVQSDSSTANQFSFNNPILFSGLQVSYVLGNAPALSATTLTVPEGGSGTLTASDPNNDPLSATFTQGANGTAAFNRTTRELTYTHNGSETTSDSFRVDISDGRNTTTFVVSVSITPVNDAPVLSNIESSRATFTEDGPPIPITGSLLVTDVDSTTFSGATVSITGNLVATEDRLLFTNTSNITGSYIAATGVLSLTATAGATLAQFQAALRSVSYFNNNTTNPNTTDRVVSLRINDGGTVNNLSNIVTRVIGVALSNDPPVLTGIEGTPVAYTENDAATAITGSLMVSDVDSATFTGATVAITGNLAATEDLLVFTNANGITGSYNAATGVLSLAGDATLAQYQAALLSVSYRNTSENPSTSTRTISFTVIDLAVLSNTVSRGLTIQAVNDAPTAANQTLSASEDTPLAITLAASDPDSTSLTFSIVSTPQNGTLSASGAGFTYTPNANFSGSDSFTFRASDGSLNSNVATVSINVGAIDDAPVAVDDAASTDEDTPRSIQVLANDTDLEGDALTVKSVSATAATNGTLEISANGRSVRYLPALDFSGVGTFSYVVSDGTLEATANVRVTVRAVNDAPTASVQSVGTPEDTPLSILLSATDPDSSAFTFQVVILPQNGTLSGSGATRTYTPNANFNGTDSFTYSASDGAADAEAARVTITVGGSNDAPIALADTAALDEDTLLNVQVLANDLDADRDALRIARVSTSASTHGVVSINANNTLNFAPEANFNGTATFSYTASDGVLESSALVTVTVRAVNDAPVARDDAASARDGAPVSVQVLANDTDFEGDALAVSAVDGGGTRGTLSIGADRKSVLFTPEPGFSGTTSFGYTVSDGSATDSARVSVQVTAGSTTGPTSNRVPVALPDAYNVVGTLQVPARGVLSNDTDADGDALTAALKSGPAHGTLRLGANGAFIYTPAVGFKGSDSFTYAARDGKSESAPVVVRLSVTPARDVTPPSLVLAGGAVRVERSLSPLRGSAADVYALPGRGIIASSGLKSVVVRLQRFGGDYWNGRAYQKAPFNLPTTQVGRSFFTVPSSAMPPLSQAPGGRYKWTAIATDNAGNIAQAQQFVQVNASAPAS